MAASSSSNADFDQLILLLNNGDSNDDISHIKTQLAKMTSVLTNERIIHKFLHLVTHVLLHPQYFSLFTSFEVSNLIRAKIEPYGILTIQSLLDAMQNNNSIIHLHNILSILSTLTGSSSSMINQILHVEMAKPQNGTTASTTVFNSSVRQIEPVHTANLRILISVPERVRNCAYKNAVDGDNISVRSSVQIPDSLKENHYYQFLTRCVLLNEHFKQYELIVDYLILMTKRGYSQLLGDQLINLVVDVKYRDHFIQMLNLFATTADSITLQKLTSEVLLSAISRGASKDVVPIFIKLVTDSNKYDNLFTEKLLTNPSTGVRSLSSDLSYLLIVTDVIRECFKDQMTTKKYEDSVFHRSMLHLVTLWKEHYFIRHTTQTQQDAITYAILILLNDMTKDQLQNTGLLNMCLQGIQNRLTSNTFNIQRHAHMIAEKTSSLMNVSNVVVLFDNCKDALQKFNDMVESYRKQELDQQQQLTTPDNNEVGPNIVQEEDTSSEECDPDEPLFGRDDSQSDDTSDSDDVDDEESDTESEDTDSDTSFEALDLQDDMQDINKIHPPKYLSELLAYLRTSPNDTDIVDKYQVALQSAETLIRKSGTSNNNHDLHELSVALCQILLHMNESYNIERFDVMRMKALIALVVYCTNRTVKFLEKEYYGSSVNLSHKHMILTVLAEAALELSNRSRSSSTHNTNDQIEELPDEIDTYSPQYPSRTRRWTSKRPKEDVAKPNLFLKYATQFFYPFIREDYSHYHLLLNEDAYLLSRLIRTCGIFVYCCGTDMTAGYDMARTLLTFVRMVRFRTEQSSTSIPSTKQGKKGDILLPHQTHLQQHTIDNKAEESKQREEEIRAVTAVRQSVLTAIMQCLMSLTSEAIIENFLEEMEEMLAWLIHESEFDPDTECRELAHTSLQILKTKINSGTTFNGDA